MAKVQCLDVQYDFIDDGKGELMLVIEAPEGETPFGEADKENAKLVFDGAANAGMLYRNSGQIIRLPTVNDKTRGMFLDGRSIVLVSEMKGEDMNDVYEAKLEVLNKDAVTAPQTQTKGGMKIDIENSYGIMQNKVNDIMFSVLERDSEPDNPQLVYDGGDHALLLRNSGHTVVLDYINKEVRQSLVKAKEVLIAEHPQGDDKNFIREFMAPVNIVERLPIQYGLPPQEKKIVIDTHEGDEPEKAGERIRKMLKQNPDMVPRIVQFYIDMANDGNAGAQYELAHLYLEGLGVEKDHEKAMDLFQKSAENGHPQAVEYFKNVKK